MKRLLVMSILVLIVFSLVSCKEKVDLSYYNQYEGYVLEGYPEDILPMYEMIAVDRCHLQVEKIYDYPKNRYSLTYYTKASESELEKYYRGILSDKLTVNDHFMTGEKDGYTLDVSLQPREDDIRVVLSAELPKDLAKNSNMFFKGFRMDLIDKYITGNEKIEYEDFGCTSNKDGTLEYRYIYEVTTSDEEVERVLGELYSSSNDFKIEKTVNGGEPIITWTADKYEIRFVYQKQYNRMTVMIIEPMPKK